MEAFATELCRDLLDRDAEAIFAAHLVKEGGLWKVASDILDNLDRPPSHGGGGGFDD